MKDGKSNISNNKQHSSKTTKIEYQNSKSAKKAKTAKNASPSPELTSSPPEPATETSLDSSKVKTSLVTLDKRTKLEMNQRTKVSARKEVIKPTKKTGFLFDEAKYEKDNFNGRSHVKALQDLTRSVKDTDLQSQKMLIAQNPFYVKKQPSQSSSKYSAQEKFSKSQSISSIQDDESNRLNNSKSPVRSLILQRPIVKQAAKNSEHVATTSTKHMTEFKNKMSGEDSFKVGSTGRMTAISKIKSTTSQSSRDIKVTPEGNKRKFSNSLDDLPPEKQAMLRFLDAEYEKILAEQEQFSN